MINQTTILETLSYILGENSVPTSAIVDSRKRFVQKTLEEVYRSYPWTFSQGTATLSISAGLATSADATRNLLAQGLTAAGNPNAMFGQAIGGLFNTRPATSGFSYGQYGTGIDPSTGEYFGSLYF